MSRSPGDGIGDDAVEAFGMLVFLAVVAVLVSRHAETSKILSAIGSPKSGLPYVIAQAISPVTGGGSNQNFYNPASPN